MVSAVAMEDFVGGAMDGRRVTIDKEQLFSRAFNARGVICWLRGDVARVKLKEREKVNGQFFERRLAR
jgi:hypothetical protein